MAQYAQRITLTPDNNWYALIVRIDKDGQESFIHGYKGRHFKTWVGAKRSTANYISAIGA